MRHGINSMRSTRIELGRDELAFMRKGLTERVFGTETKKRTIKSKLAMLAAYLLEGDRGLAVTSKVATFHVQSEGGQEIRTPRVQKRARGWNSRRKWRDVKGGGRRYGDLDGDRTVT